MISSLSLFEAIRNEDNEQITDLIINNHLIDEGICFCQNDFENNEMLVNSFPTPLMVAAYLGKENAFNYLLSNGALYSNKDRQHVSFSIFFFFSTLK